jgi:hypothetical protein
LEKDNFIREFAKEKENVKLCMVGIEKKCKHKKIQNLKNTLFSLKYSISLVENLN